MRCRRTICRWYYAGGNRASYRLGECRPDEHARIEKERKHHHALPSVQSVETATGRHAASSRSTNACLASMRSTVSLPSGSRVGRFGASTSLMMALASFAGSPRRAWLTLAAWSRFLRRCAHPSGRARRKILEDRAAGKLKQAATSALWEANGEFI